MTDTEYAAWQAEREARELTKPVEALVLPDPDQDWDRREERRIIGQDGECCVLY